MNTKRIIYLSPPHVSLEHIKEKIICIRAHRERIFRTEFEVLKDKHIFHNYGQGGAGLTFLFGCVNESLRQYEQYIRENPALRTKSIAVIGAGCYGLLTALMLARKGHSVQIFAKEIDNLPSHKAAGFFFPRPRKSSTPKECAIFYARGIESYVAYKKIIDGCHPFLTEGAKIVPAYFGLDIDPGFGPYRAQSLMPPPESVTINFGTTKSYDAVKYKTMFIQSSELMSELQQAVHAHGIPLIKKEIVSFSDVHEHIIFNCSGWGAKTLAKDTKIVPVQGHLITLKNQPCRDQLQYMINFKVTVPSGKVLPAKGLSANLLRDELIYYAPKESGILGITFIRGEDSLIANQHEFDRLLQRCQDFFGHRS